jgi:hypothetical protein
MKYVITVTDHKSDENSPSIYLTALGEDISNTSGVTAVEIKGERITFDSNLSDSELKEAFKPFFSSVFDHVRFVSIGKA